jgi:uncharacterized protein DUF4367
MPELDRDLRALAAAIEWPAEPELGTRVRERLVKPAGRYGRLLAVAIAVLVVAVAAAFAVPDSRSAILRFFGLEGVTVIEVDTLPRVQPGPLAFGDPTTLRKAESTLGFEALLPRLGKPDEVRVDEGSYLIVVYSGGRIRLSEFQGGVGIVKKLAGAGVEQLTVNGGPGLWVPAGHLVFELGRQPRLAANTLLWEQKGLTIRLEGRLTKAKALEIAASVR